MFRALSNKLASMAKFISKPQYVVLLITTAFVALGTLQTGSMYNIVNMLGITNASAASATDASSTDSFSVESLAHSASTTPSTTKNNTTSSQTTSSTPNSTDHNGSSTKSTTSTPIKYSVSDDPRSTAYSTTPPQSSAADFTIFITHAGQVAPGTQISYSAERQGESTYYGGDLVFNTSSLTYSISSGSDFTTPFTVSTPDGDEANIPSQPVNDRSSFSVPVTNVSASPGNSWTEMLNIYSKPTPQVAPYIIHLQTFRLPASGNDYEYDGFISLYVTN